MKRDLHGLGDPEKASIMLGSNVFIKGRYFKPQSWTFVMYDLLKHLTFELININDYKKNYFLLLWNTLSATDSLKCVQNNTL